MEDAQTLNKDIANKQIQEMNLLSLSSSNNQTTDENEFSSHPTDESD